MLKNKRIIGLVLAFMLVLSAVPMGLAVESDSPLMFENPDGTVVEYYLDEHMNPYNYFDGEKLYLAIPLPHMLVTDEEMLAILDETLPDDPQSLEISPSEISPFAVPPANECIDLRAREYSQNVDLSKEQVIISPIFTWSFSPRQISFGISNIKKPLFASSEIHLIYSVYNIGLDEWQSFMYSNLDIGGSHISFLLFSGETHARFFFNRAYDITSCTYTVKTFPIQPIEN